MKNIDNYKRLITCEFCGRMKFTYFKDRDICRQCYCNQPTNLCSRCGEMKRQVSLLGLCPRCTKIKERPIATCSRCSQTKPIYNQTDWLCQTCQQIARHASRKAKQNKIECSVCGCMKSSALLGEQICRACWRERRYGYQRCSQCGQFKVLYNKSHQLCQLCNQNRLARDSLLAYLTNFSTPYPYNKTLFDLIAKNINWDCVDNNKNRRFRIFGRFLQANQLTQPLTWSAIDNALPKLGATGRTNPMLIRSCLFELGHLLASLGQIESRELYLSRRRALMPIRNAPEHLQQLMNDYATWLGSRKTVFSNVRDHLETLSVFWLWSAQHSINLPHEVQPSLINNYLLTLNFQWQCSLCQMIIPFDPNHRLAPKVCNCCGAVGSYVQVKRLAQNTVRQHRGKLKVFFDWALMNKMVIINPVQRSIRADNPTIRHYPLEIIRQLCSYIISPDADPIEAIVLYLIIFHALSVWELRHVQIPCVIPITLGILPLKLSEVDYFIVPKKEPSCGKHSPGRPSLKLNIPKNALPWLRPHLESIELIRQLKNTHQNNQYLLVSTSSAHHNKPVGKTFPSQIVRSASFKVNGTICNPNTLRKTVGVMMADIAGGGILRFLGWEDTQAFGYTWIPREIVYPQQPKNSQPSESTTTLEIEFPSMKT